jgi:hypothetical protein
MVVKDSTTVVLMENDHQHDAEKIKKIKFRDFLLPI